MRTVLLTTVAVAMVLLTACDGEYPYSRRYPCNFYLKQQTHSTSLAFAAIQGVGTWVSISTSGDGLTSVRHVYVTGNEKNAVTEDIIIRNDDENRRSFLLGRNNSVGLLVGGTNFNGPTAYDRSCPNCETLETLQFTGNRQQVSCSKCQRTYMLDTGGIISGSKGETLLLYACELRNGWLWLHN